MYLEKESLFQLQSISVFSHRAGVLEDVIIPPFNPKPASM
jgi:hypothetical protein